MGPRNILKRLKALLGGRTPLPPGPVDDQLPEPPQKEKVPVLAEPFTSVETQPVVHQFRVGRDRKVPLFRLAEELGASTREVQRLVREYRHGEGAQWNEELGAVEIDYVQAHVEPLTAPRPQNKLSKKAKKTDSLVKVEDAFLFKRTVLGREAILQFLGPDVPELVRQHLDLLVDRQGNLRDKEREGLIRARLAVRVLNLRVGMPDEDGFSLESAAVGLMKGDSILVLRILYPAFDSLLHELFRLLEPTVDPGWNLKDEVVYLSKQKRILNRKMADDFAMFNTRHGIAHGIVSFPDTDLPGLIGRIVDYLEEGVRIRVRLLQG